MNCEGCSTKGPGVLDDRAPVNCSSGKYLSSYYQARVPRLEPGEARVSWIQAVEGLQNRTTSDCLGDPTRPSGFSSHRGCGINGSEVALWQVPARSTDQRVLPTRHRCGFQGVVAA